MSALHHSKRGNTTLSTGLKGGEEVSEGNLDFIAAVQTAKRELSKKKV